MNEYKTLQNALEYIRSITDFVPEIALVLGSGLGDLAKKIDTACEINYKDIPNFPVSTVQGHQGKFVFGYLSGVRVVAMQGRVHFYEGYSSIQVVRPIRIMKMLGASVLMLTNASGGISENLNAGTLMMISGQISSFVTSPLIGENIDELGTRFPDMSEIYSKKLQEILINTAKKQEIKLEKGVYLQCTGANYESPEEIKMYKLLGADAVGMSTAIEAIAAKHCGFQVCGISCICNKAAGLQDKPLSHEEVKKAANSVAKDFCRLVEYAVKNISDCIID